jgi:hypothetical protein
MIAKKRFMNNETGEIEIHTYTSLHHKYPKRGATPMYTDIALEAIAGLSQNEARLFHFMVINRDKYNVLTITLSKAAREAKLNWSRSYLSGRLKKMIELNLVKKLGSKIWINPYIIKPPYDQDDPESQWETQQLWDLMFNDKDNMFPGYDELLNNIFGIKERTKEYMIIGRGKYEKKIRIRYTHPSGSL